MSVIDSPLVQRSRADRSDRARKRPRRAIHFGGNRQRFHDFSAGFHCYMMLLADPIGHVLQIGLRQPLERSSEILNLRILVPGLHRQIATEERKHERNNAIEKDHEKFDVARTDGFRCAAPPVADKVRQPKVQKRDRDQRRGRANRDERVANAIRKMVARTDAAQLIDAGRQPRQWRNNKYSKPQDTEIPSGPE